MREERRRETVIKEDAGASGLTGKLFHLRLIRQPPDAARRVTEGSENAVDSPRDGLHMEQIIIVMSKML